MKNKAEKETDRLYNIETCIFDNRNEDSNHRAYEPTPYAVLDLLIDSEFVLKEDTVVDMGCGKGRVVFYLSDKTGCSAKGVEYSEDIYKCAINNLKEINKPVNITFFNEPAEKYNISIEDSVFFFFNPFSTDILSKVLYNIEKSYYEFQREIKLIFYYPTLEFVGELISRSTLEFVDEIDCSHLYRDSKGRECVMIFKVI